VDLAVQVDPVARVARHHVGVDRAALGRVVAFATSAPIMCSSLTTKTFLASVDICPIARRSMPADVPVTAHGISGPWHEPSSEPVFWPCFRTRPITFGRAASFSADSTAPWVFLSSAANRNFWPAELVRSCRQDCRCPQDAKSRNWSEQLGI